MADKVTSTHVAPEPVKNAVQTNYMTKYDFATKYIPTYKEELVELFPDTILGFTALFGTDIGVASDQFFWAEDGRLRKIEKNVGLASASGVFTCQDETIQRVGNKIYVMNPETGVKQMGRVMSLNADNKKEFTAQPYDAAAWNVGTEGLNVITTGSEFKKGTDGMEGSIVTQQEILHTSLTISKDNFVMNDSDICNATWLKAPDGKYFWFHQEVENFHKRFDELEELNAITSVKITEDSPLHAEGYNSTSGLIESIRMRGNTMTGIPSSLDDMDEVIKVLDKESGEKSNGLFLTLEASLSLDNTIADANVDRGGAGWGSFDNKATAVKFGFDGWMRGGYEFYKKTWRLLNDVTGLSVENTGTAGAIHGIMMPFGTVKVQTGYNSSLSGTPVRSIKYLTLLHKEGNGLNRNRSTIFYGRRWGNGRKDVTGVDILSETGLCLAGANRWFAFVG